MAESESFIFDLRIRELNLKRGQITRDDIKKHLKNIPDDQEWAEELIVFEEETEVAEISPSSEAQDDEVAESSESAEEESSEEKT